LYSAANGEMRAKES